MQEIKTVEKQVKWDLKGVELSDQEEIQKSLEEGYEPFAVTPMMKKTPQNVLNLQAQNPQMVLENVMWLRRAMVVEVQ